jgi:hypothetical protein
MAGSILFVFSCFASRRPCSAMAPMRSPHPTFLVVAGRGIDLPPSETLSGAALIGLVIVVPAFTHGEQGQAPVAARIVPCHVAFASVHMGKRVDAEGGVVEKHRAPKESDGQAGPSRQDEAEDSKGKFAMGVASDPAVVVTSPVSAGKLAPGSTVVAQFACVPLPRQRLPLVVVPTCGSLSENDGACHVPSPRRKVVLSAVPEPSRAGATVPEVKLLALNEVSDAPEPANEVAVIEPALRSRWSQDRDQSWPYGCQGCRHRCPVKPMNHRRLEKLCRWQCRNQAAPARRCRMKCYWRQAHQQSAGACE